MARSARAEGEGGGSAARVAARRRAPRGSSERGSSEPGPAKKAPGKSAGKGRAGKGKAGKGPSALARAFKLGLLVLAFCCIGFFAVLVLDVSAGLIGQVRLGETTVVELWGKVVDRFLDRDVPKPEPTKAAAKPTKPGRASSAGPSAVAERAPAPATRPEEDARHVTERPDRLKDPEVEQAKKRLDDLLGRL